VKVITKTQEETIQGSIKDHETAFQATFTSENIRLLERISRELASALKRGNKILLCGNGGSAADCQHIAAEFIGRFKQERPSLPAIALTTDTSILTALSNDYSFELVFARQVEGLGKEGDILIAISTSGNSNNVLHAARKAKEMGITVIGLTGRSGGKLRNLADFIFSAASEKTPHVQEMHITALHAVSEAVETLLFPGIGDRS
jgi:D-sedoheptulose 7-phosphate isomerase